MHRADVTARNDFPLDSDRGSDSTSWSTTSPSLDDWEQDDQREL